MREEIDGAGEITVDLGADPRTAATGHDGRAAQSPLPKRRMPDLGDTAVFMLDGAGRATSWPLMAARLFACPRGAVIGRDICDVLLTGPGQRELVRRALEEVRQGRTTSATIAGGKLGDGRIAIRFEPVAGPEDGAAVLVHRIPPLVAPAWLSEAAARIGSSLDLTRTAAEIADAVVPGFADGVSVYVAERLLAAIEAPQPFAPGRVPAMRRLAARIDGQDQALTDLALHPGEILFFDPGTPIGEALATGKPVKFSQPDADTADRIGRRPGGDIALSFTSFLVMPFVARGEVVGAVVLCRALVSPVFNADDIAQAGELAVRAAMYVENARLYEQERRTALALKWGLLPGHPDIPPGLEVAHRYLAVGDSVVGGDWHDIVAMPDGRTALIVGDVMGHGPEAAAVMAQLRTAAHTLADLGLPPGQVLAKLDQMVARMTAAQFATCVYVVTDPGASSCVVAVAGHLPPVLVRPGGFAEVLELPPGLPVGLGADTAVATEVSLPPGATLAMFTDGLVEDRARSLDDGLAALVAALGSALAPPRVPLDQATDAVIGQLGERREDDATLVLARVRASAL